MEKQNIEVVSLGKDLDFIYKVGTTDGKEYINTDFRRESDKNKEK